MENIQLIQDERMPSEYVDTDSKVLAQAKAQVVEDQMGYDIAVAMGKAFSGIIKERKDYFAPRKAAAQQVHKMWVEAEKDSIQPLEEAKSIIGKKCLKYEREQEEIRRAEEARLRRIAEEKARKEREEYERKQAELKERAAEEEISEEEKEQLSMEFEPTVEPTEIKVENTFHKGGQTRKTWYAEVTDLAALVEHCFRSGEHELLLANTTKLNQLAKAHKKESTIPGVKFYTKETKIL